jgi:flagellar motor switch protein FliN/FliY
VKCAVGVVLGTGTISVRQCIALARNSIVRLDQSAGEDLQVLVGGTLIARGEVVIFEDSTAVRLTEIARSQAQGGSR